MFEEHLIPISEKWASERVEDWYPRGLNFQNFLACGDVLSWLQIDLQRFAPQRVREKWGSRLALLLGLRTLLGIEGDWKQLEIVSHHYLKNFPDYIVSITHNHDLAVAVISKRSQFFSIGIDIEAINRPIKKESARFFVNSLDDVDSQSLLKLWCAKEAAFKAIYPLVSLMGWKRPLALSDVWVRGHHFGIFPKVKEAVAANGVYAQMGSEQSNYGIMAAPLQKKMQKVELIAWEMGRAKDKNPERVFSQTLLGTLDYATVHFDGKVNYLVRAVVAYS
ncbi:MAG: 4'-phosphopantetheinyl transferase superfamily protein [Oligoflexia bacterium]|nr:4'-phosphopantetheinyl transferase superfamily protein [Oligoflexia bacterium]